MELIFTPEVVLTALGVFLMRIINMALDTIRVLLSLRGKKTLTWILGFLQSIIYVLALAPVLTNLTNLVILFGYAAGFGTGNILGMYFEERMAIGHLRITVVSPNRGRSITEELRKAGYAVTETAGRGKDGSVSILNTNVFRKNLSKVEQIVLEIDPNAFITSEDVKPINRGFWR
jgi:uncharacterized protein YebE (UPF0316 family)